jgi:hypothetical protein
MAIDESRLDDSAGAEPDEFIVPPRIQGATIKTPVDEDEE